MLDDATRDFRAQAAAMLDRMRRNDRDPKLRQYGLRQAAETLNGAYLPAAEHLIEQGCRGQAVAAAINVASSAGDQPDEQAPIVLAWRKNAEFDARRKQLEVHLARRSDEARSDLT
jgi:hypothetical protein